MPGRTRPQVRRRRWVGSVRRVAVARPALVGAVEVEDRGAGQLLEGAGGLEGDHLAAGVHRAAAREVAFAQRRVGEQHAELGGDGAEDGHPFALDQLQRQRGVEALHRDGRHAEVGGGEVRGPLAEAEGRGDRRHEDLVLGEVADFDRALVEVPPAVLRVHHALRQAGGAGGRVDQPELVGAEAVGEVGGRRPGLGAVAEDRQLDAVLEAGDDDVVAEVVEALVQRREVLGGRGAAVLVVGDQRAGPALGEDVLRLALARPHADPDGDDAGLLAAEEGRVDGPAVGQHHADAVAAPEPELPQGARDPVRGGLVAGPLSVPSGPAKATASGRSRRAGRRGRRASRPPTNLPGGTRQRPARGRSRTPPFVKPSKRLVKYGTG